MDSQRKVRLAILQSHPIQYFSPLYRRLAQEENIDLTVYYLSSQGAEKYFDKDLGVYVQWDVSLLDGYQYKFLPDIWGNIPSTFADGIVHPAIISEVYRGRYDALWMYGYKHPSYLLAIAAAKLSKAALLIRTDTHPKLARLQHRTLKNRIRTPILRLMYGLFDGALAIGTNNANHYRALGMANDKIFLVPFAVDNDLFMSNNHWSADTAEVVKQELGIPPGTRVILFVGKLVPNKQPLILLKAFQQMQKVLTTPAALVFVGDGELRGQLECYCRENGVSNVVFAGFVNQRHISRYYAVADIFVLLSIQETWGLVLNEAMCAGNTVIVSDAVGSAADLVLPGENGFTFPVGDVDVLAEHLTTLVHDPELCRRMGERSLKIINKWSFEQDIAGLQKALAYIRREG